MQTSDKYGNHLQITQSTEGNFLIDTYELFKPEIAHRYIGDVDGAATAIFFFEDKSFIAVTKEGYGSYPTDHEDYIKVLLKLSYLIKDSIKKELSHAD